MAEELECIEEVAENGSESGEKDDWENGEAADIIKELQLIEEVTENGRESEEEDWDKIEPPAMREGTTKPEYEFEFLKNYSLIIKNNYNTIKYFLVVVFKTSFYFNCFAMDILGFKITIMSSY